MRENSVHPASLAAGGKVRSGVQAVFVLCVKEMKQNRTIFPKRLRE